MNVLLHGSPSRLAELRRELMGSTALPLISALAAEVPSAQLESLSRRYPDLSWTPDAEVVVGPAPEGRPHRLQSAGPSLRAPFLWNQGYRGQGVNVAVVDTGITRHKDFGNRIVAFHDVLAGKTEPYDDHGHGAHVAGIVAGNGADSKGKHVGIAPEAGLVAIKAFDRNGKARSSDVIKAIQWAVEHRERYNIRVLNLSAAGRASISHQHDPLARAAVAAWNAGIFVVVAAGNDGPEKETIGSPGHSPVVLTVGADDDRGTPDRGDDRLAGLSSRGPTPVDHLTKPDLIAPGVDITAAYNGKGGYATKSGTSMAAPMVSGLAALLLNARPSATPQQLKDALVNSGEKLPKGGDANCQGTGLVDGQLALDFLTA